MLWGIVLLLFAGFFLMAAGSFSRIINYVLAEQLPELERHLTYKSARIHLDGKAVFKEIDLHFGGVAKGVSLQSPQLHVSFHLPSLLVSLIDKKKAPRFSSIAMKEATLSWNRENKMMSNGSIATAFRSIAQSKDLALLSEAHFSIGKLRLRPPSGWTPSLISKVSPLQSVSFRLNLDQPNAMLAFEKMQMNLYGGTVEGEVLLPLDKKPITLQAKLSNLSLKEAATLFMPSSAILEGKLSGELNARSPADQIWAVETKGRLLLSDLIVSGLNLQKGEVIQKRAPSFEVVALDQIAVEPLSINRKQLNWKMEGVGEQFDFKAEGSGTTEGVFRLSMATTIHPEAHAKLPWLTQTGLKPTAAGGSELVLKISGDLEKQRIDNYKDLFRSGINHGLKNTGRSLIRAFKF